MDFIVYDRDDDDHHQPKLSVPDSKSPVVVQRQLLVENIQHDELLVEEPQPLVGDIPQVNRLLVVAEDNILEIQG
jgi:hypothetical protein